MANLRKADEALKQAEVNVQNQIAAIKKAIADKIAAEAKAKQIENDYQEALKEAELQGKLDEIEKAHEDWLREKALADLEHQKTLLEKQAELAQAQLEYDQAIRDIKLAAKDLSPKEKQMLISSAAAYAAAQKALAEQTLVVMQKEQDLKDAEAELKLAEPSFEAGTIFETEVERQAKQEELETAMKELTDEKDELKEKKDEAERQDLKSFKVDNSYYYNYWASEVETYERDIKSFETDKEYYIRDVAEYYVQPVHDAVTAIQKIIKDWMTMNPEPAKDATEDEVADFEEALAAFVGTHVDEKTGKPVLNIEYKNLASWLPVKEFKGNQTEEIVAYLKELAEKFYEVDKLGDFGDPKTGTLHSYVGLFAGSYGDLKDCVNNFQNRTKNIDEQIVHFTILKEAAQAAALVYAQAHEFVEEFGEVTIDSENYDDWADLVEAFNKAKEEYIAELEKQIEENEEAWDELDAQHTAVMYNHISFYYKERIAKATIALEMAEKVQGGLQKAADQLKSIYNNIYKMVSENYEGVIDFSSLLGLDDMNDLSEILNQVKDLSWTFDQFMDVLNRLQN